MLETPASECSFRARDFWNYECAFAVACEPVEGIVAFDSGALGFGRVVSAEAEYQRFDACRCGQLYCECEVCWYCGYFWQEVFDGVGHGVACFVHVALHC